ncbi:MAG: U32 family peptidase [Clostridia bacterium]|nr:U32 family peptidase [Clostridia bacterium]
MQNTSLKNVELLAPAGSYDSFIAAINAGADAVYMGLKNFNARVMTNNFGIEEYKEAIDYAHKRDVKVYLTLNTLLVDSEIKEALESVCELYKVGLDGVIVQDLGIADLIHKLMPDISLHASTQMSICTLDQVKVLESLGFERVVLARELSIQEIKDIAQNTKLEIEVFVHGALCVSVSGQCLMSSMIGDRSANRGSCAGPCRKRYSLYSSSGKAIQKNRYLLSKKDIYGLDKIEELIDAGVYSLKVEGRNKTPEYVAGVIKNYRNAIDNGYTKKQDREVLQLFNRSGKSDGYLNGVRYRESISEFSPKNTGLLLGKVIQVKNEYIKIELKEDIDLHDGVECIDNAAVSTIVTCIRDDKFNVINKRVEKGNIVWLGDIRNVQVGDVIYKTSSNKLNQEYKRYASLNLKKLEYDVTVNIQKNKPMQVSMKDITVELDCIPEQAKTSGLSEEKLKDTFAKTENTSVKLNVTANIEQGLFVPVAKLNELRNMLVQKIEQSKLVRKEIQDIDKKIKQVLDVKLEKINYKNKRGTNSLYIYKYNPDIDYIKYYKDQYNEKLDIMYINAVDFKLYEQDILKYLPKCKIYFAILNVTLGNVTKYIKENIQRLIELGVSGVLIGNIGYLDICNELKQKYNIELVADYTLNITNKYTALKLKELGIDILTPLVETNLDIQDLHRNFYTESVEDLICVMTTRYCVISSFVKNSTKRADCNLECTKEDYYLLDEQNKRYDVITDNMDCITRLITKTNNNVKSSNKNCRVRHCIM